MFDKEKSLLSINQYAGEIFRRESVVGILIASTLFLMVALVPYAGFLMSFVAPLPIIYYALRFGRINGLLIAVASLILTEAVLRGSGFNVNISILLLLGASGLIMAEFLKRKFSIEKVVFYSALGILGLALAFLLVYSLRTGEQPWSVVENYIRASMAESIRQYSTFGVSPDQVRLIQDNAGRISTTLYHLFPAIAVMAALLFAWLNVIAGKFLFQPRGIGYPDFGDLAFWKIPDQLVWFVIASGGIILVPVDRLQIAGLNLLLIFIFVYIFQGLSIINYFFKKKEIPPLFRMLFYFLLFAQHFLLLLVMTLGFFDIWIDFRKLNKIQKDTSETALGG